MTVFGTFKSAGKVKKESLESDLKIVKIVKGDGYVQGIILNKPVSIGTAKLSGLDLDLFAGRESTTYVADALNHVICQVYPDLNEPGKGRMSVFCGVEGERGTDLELCSPKGKAKFNAPQGVAVDPVDGTVYISDTGNHSIRMIQYGVPTVYLIAGGTSPGFKDVSAVEINNHSKDNQSAKATPMDARFYQPVGIAVRTRSFRSKGFPLDDSNATDQTALRFSKAERVTEVFVADRLNHCVRLIRLRARNTDGTFATLDVREDEGLKPVFEGVSKISPETYLRKRGSYIGLYNKVQLHAERPVHRRKSRAAGSQLGRQL
jgi:hypothetical protein